MDRQAKHTILSSVARLTLNVILRRDGTEVYGVFCRPGLRPRPWWRHPPASSGYRPEWGRHGGIRRISGFAHWRSEPPASCTPGKPARPAGPEKSWRFYCSANGLARAAGSRKTTRCSRRSSRCDRIAFQFTDVAARSNGSQDSRRYQTSR